MSDEELQCQFCKKDFRKLSSLSVHLCEPKRRAQQEKDPGVQFGYRTFNRFYELTQGATKQRTYAQFSDSSYYSAFVKFGQYIVSIQAVNPAVFIDWIIMSNKKLDHWTQSKYYDEYLLDYLKKENSQDAVERAMKEMIKWGESNDAPFNHFFIYGSANKICQMINNGRISPWVIFNCNNGVTFLSKLNTEQLEVIYSIIDPAYWERKFKIHSEDTEWTKDVLTKAQI